MKAVVQIGNADLEKIKELKNNEDFDWYYFSPTDDLEFEIRQLIPHYPEIAIYPPLPHILNLIPENRRKN